MLQFHSQQYGLEAHYALCYYIPGGLDYLSRKILDFKDGKPETISRWSRWLVDEIAQERLTFDYVVRSLGSSETVASNSRPVDVLGHDLSCQLGIPYVPSILAKNRRTTKLALLSAVGRREELRGVYYLTKACPDLSGKRILILDDVVTAYTTTTAIASVIQAQYPSARIIAISLGRTERRDGANNYITTAYMTQPLTRAVQPPVRSFHVARPSVSYDEDLPMFE